MNFPDASNVVERNEDIFVTRTPADKITKITEYKNTEGRAAERSTTLYSTRIRKTSISMPTNLDEMEDLRIDRQKVSEKVIKKKKKRNTIRLFLDTHLQTYTWLPASICKSKSRVYLLPCE